MRDETPELQGTLKNEVRIIYFGNCSNLPSEVGRNIWKPLTEFYINDYAAFLNFHSDLFKHSIGFRAGLVRLLMNLILSPHLPLILPEQTMPGNHTGAVTAVPGK